VVVVRAVVSAIGTYRSTVGQEGVLGSGKVVFLAVRLGGSGPVGITGKDG